MSFMVRIVQIFLALLLVLTSSVPAFAVVLDWMQVEGARIRLSFGTTAKDKFTVGLIEVELEEGWKTYWKNPGPSGMTPQLTIEGREETILFPFPSLIRGKVPDDWSFGYQGRVTFPFLFSRTEREREDINEISGTLDIGICKEICIPALVDFHVTTQSTLDAVVVGRYKAVRASFDQSINETFGGVVLGKIEENELFLQIRVPRGEKTPQLFAYSEGVELGLPKLVVKNGDTRAYSVPILSGRLLKGDLIEYVLEGESITIGAGVIVP